MRRTNTTKENYGTMLLTRLVELGFTTDSTKRCYASTTKPEFPIKCGILKG